MLFLMKLPQKIRGWTAGTPGAKLELREYPFPELGEGDVALEVHHCGICHSDLHLVQGDWGTSKFPIVPGHEILGKVIGLGPGVAHLKIGQMVGVGWQSSSCGHCMECLAGRQNLCDRSGATCVGHLGGYSDFHVTKSAFCFPVPDSLAKPAVAPLFCGGITVYSPLCEFVTRKEARIAVVGLGGLGHLAVKFARALGHEVAVFSSSPSKAKEARDLGAHHFHSSAQAEEIESLGRRYDLVLVTANVDLPYESYLSTLRSDGVLCFVGIPPSPMEISVDALLGKRLRVAASPIGSPSRILEMVDFAGRHGILAETESYPMDEVNEVLPKVKANKVRYRAVLSRV